MANNTYIGNRYVPIFANPVEWDNLRAYEPLTIVTRQGTSYTSRKYVPAGVDISNTEYWVLTGNYNAQVDQYREEVAELESSVNTTVNGVNEKIDLLKLGTVIFIGDSYLMGWTPTADVTPWGTYLAGYLGKTMNVDAFSYAYGGTGFGANNDGQDFITLLNDAYMDNRVDNTKVGAVIALGGANEPDESSVITGVNTFVRNAHTYFPNAKVYYGYGTTFVSTTPYRVMAINGYYERANCDGAYMGNLAQHLTANYEIYMANDQRHANEGGQKYLAKLAYQCIVGGGITPINIGSRSVHEKCIEYVADGMWTLFAWDYVTGNPSATNYTCNGNNLLVSLAKTDSIQSKSDNFFYRCNADGIIQIGSKYVPTMFKLVSTPTSIDVYARALNDSGTNYATGDINNYQINPFRMNVPVELV